MGGRNRVRPVGTAGRHGGRRVPTATATQAGRQIAGGALPTASVLPGRSRPRRGRIEPSGGAPGVAAPKGPALPGGRLGEV